MLLIAVSQVLVEADKAIRWLQRQHRSAGRQHIHTVDELAAFDAHHYPGPGTGFHDGFQVAPQRRKDAKAAMFLQMFGNL